MVTNKCVRKNLAKLILSLTIIMPISSCSKDSLWLSHEKSLPLNAFSMRMNGYEWKPGEIGGNKCMCTFNGAWSAFGKKVLFNIVAYQDPNGITGTNSDQTLQLQIKDVEGLGKYQIDGSYLETFGSYAILSVKKPDGGNYRYVNKRNISSFCIVFESFMPITASSLKGIKGTFFGTLYNESNLLDSIKITTGEFTFKTTNRYNFNQCQ